MLHEMLVCCMFRHTKICWRLPWKYIVYRVFHLCKSVEGVEIPRKINGLVSERDVRRGKCKVKLLRSTKASWEWATASQSIASWVWPLGKYLRKPGSSEMGNACKGFFHSIYFHGSLSWRFPSSWSTPHIAKVFRVDESQIVHLAGLTKDSPLRGKASSQIVSMIT